MNYSKALVDLGLELSKLDPALFFFFEDHSNDKSEVRKPSGIISTHVDDSLSVGSETFREKVEKPMMNKFTYGAHDDPPFRYVGFCVKKTKDAITLDQDHYIKTLCKTDLKLNPEAKLDDLLVEQDQVRFRSVAAKLAMLSVTSRPDLAFEAKIMTTRYGKATKRDMREALRRLRKLKTESTRMVYPNLGKLKDWVILGFADASLYAMPDRVGSVGGQVLMMANRKTDRACVLGWRSKQLSRVVHSSLAAEALSLMELFGDLTYTKQMLLQIFGTQVNQIPVIAVTDSNNLHQAVHSIKSVEDKRLVSTIAELKEAMSMEFCAHELRHLPGQFMIADGLTKKGGQNEELMCVLQTGRYTLQGGWDIVRRTGFTIRSWMDMNKEDEEILE